MKMSGDAGGAGGGSGDGRGATIFALLAELLWDESCGPELEFCDGPLLSG